MNVTCRVCVSSDQPRVKRSVTMLLVLAVPSSTDREQWGNWLLIHWNGGGKDQVSGENYRFTNRTWTILLFYFVSLKYLKSKTM